jgi:predicted permease
MENLWRDLRFGVRALIKAPAFTAAAMLSLALGIGVNTTIFTVINSLFLNPLPVDRASELVTVYTIDANNSGSSLGTLLPVSFPNYKDFRDTNSVFSSLAAYGFPLPVGLSTGGEPDQAFLELVTGNYFSTLGVRPAAGRLFGPAEDRAPGASPVIVLSHDCWLRRFGGTDVSGRSVTINGTPFSVIGVAPEGFHGVNSLFGPDGWVPTMMYREVLPSAFRTWIDERRALVFSLAGRLKPGVTIDQARANLTAVAKSLEQTYPAPNRGRTVTLRPLAEATVFPAIRGALVLGGTVMMVIVGLVLLIACSNVANLLLARATSRSQEIAVRLALGAPRSRLVQQLLTESVLLGVMGGALGLLVARWSLSVIVASRPPVIAANFVELHLDGRVLIFTFGISLVTGLLFGLAPALQAAGVSVVGALKDNTRGAGRRRRTFGLANLLIIGQVALSLIALITAALFMRSSQAASKIDPGFDTDHVAVIGLSPGQQGYEQGRAEQFYQELTTHVQALPGVRKVSLATNLPLFGFLQRSVFIEGREQDPNAAPILTTSNVIGPGYFETESIPLLRGRDFTDADRAGALPVAIVNEAMAHRYWPGEEALGKRFRFYTEQAYRQIVGVAKTVKYGTLGEAPQAAAYAPLGQSYSDSVVLYVRAQGDPAALIEPVRREIRRIDPQMPIQNPQVVKTVIAQSLWAVKFGAALLGVFGVLALVLACVGLYGVMSYTVGQRTREIGLRMALGASPWTAMTLVLRQGMTLVGLGVVIGVMGGRAVSQYIAALLYGSANDATSFAGASLALLVVAALASLLPARRASRVDPIVALREG